MADIYVTLSCIVIAVLLIFNEKFIPEIPFSTPKEEPQKESGLIDFSGNDDKTDDGE